MAGSLFSLSETAVRSRRRRIVRIATPRRLQSCLFLGAERRRGRGGGAGVPPHEGEGKPAADQQQHRAGQPQHGIAQGEGRTEEHEFAITGDDELEDLAVAVAGLETLAHQQAQVAGDVGVRIVDRFPLADHAAQVLRQGPGARLQGRVGQDLVGLDRPGRPRQQQGQREGEGGGGEDGAHRAHSAGRGAAGAARALRAGAPTR